MEMTHRNTEKLKERGVTRIFITVCSAKGQIFSKMTTADTKFALKLSLGIRETKEFEYRVAQLLGWEGK